MRFCSNKSRNYVQSVNIKSTYSEFKSLPTVSLKVYSDYRVNLLCWIKQFATFTNGLQTYFLRTSRVIGCMYIFISLDKQSLTDHPNHKSVTPRNIRSWRRSFSRLSSQLTMSPRSMVLKVNDCKADGRLFLIDGSTFSLRIFSTISPMYGHIWRIIWGEQSRKPLKLS